MDCIALNVGNCAGRCLAPLHPRTSHPPMMCSVDTPAKLSLRESVVYGRRAESVFSVQEIQDLARRMHSLFCRRQLHHAARAGNGETSDGAATLLSHLPHDE